jgi:hypothetical protein
MVTAGHERAIYPNTVFFRLPFKAENGKKWLTYPLVPCSGGAAINHDIKLGRIGLGFVSLRHFYPITKPVSEHHLLKIALWFSDKQ